MTRKKVKHLRGRSRRAYLSQSDLSAFLGRVFDDLHLAIIMLTDRLDVPFRQRPSRRPREILLKFVHSRP